MEIEYSSQFLLNSHPMPSGIELDERLNMGMRALPSGFGLQYPQALGGNWQREQFTSKGRNWCSF